MATSILASAVRPVNHTTTTALLSVGDVAARWGVHVNSVRNYANAGELPTVVLPSGHRRFRLADCLEFFEGLTPEDLEEDGGEASAITVYARVSSESQDKAGSLNRQLDRLLTEVATREGIDREAIQVFRDVASSFGARDGLNKLVDAMLTGTVKTVYVEHFNRYSRVPALTRLLEHIAERSGVRVVALDTEDEDKDSLQADVRELVDFVQVIANRSAARKSKLVTVKGLSAECIARMVELRKLNTPIATIARILNEEGFTTSHGDSITRGLVQSRLDSNGTETALMAATGAKAQPGGKATFTKWAETHLVKTEGGKVAMRQVVDAYNAYCKANGLLEETGVRIGLWSKWAEKKVVGRDTVMLGYALA